jgi:hypothetical protein
MGFTNLRALRRPAIAVLCGAKREQKDKFRLWQNIRKNSPPPSRNRLKPLKFMLFAPVKSLRFKIEGFVNLNFLSNFASNTAKAPYLTPLFTLI